MLNKSSMLKKKESLKKSIVEASQEVPLTDERIAEIGKDVVSLLKDMIRLDKVPNLVQDIIENTDISKFENEGRVVIARIIAQAIVNDRCYPGNILWNDTASAQAKRELKKIASEISLGIRNYGI